MWRDDVGSTPPRNASEPNAKPLFDDLYGLFMGRQHAPCDCLPPANSGFFLQTAKLLPILLSRKTLEKKLEFSVGPLGTAFSLYLSPQKSAEIVAQAVGKQLAGVSLNHGGEIFPRNVAAICRQPFNRLQILGATFLEDDIDRSTHVRQWCFRRLSWSRYPRLRTLLPKWPSRVPSHISFPQQRALGGGSASAPRSVQGQFPPVYRPPHEGRR